MRVADTLLDLDAEAIPAANAMYAILQKHYKWRWPNEEKHLLSWQDDRGPYIRDLEQEGEENEEQGYGRAGLEEKPGNNMNGFAALSLPVAHSIIFDNVTKQAWY